MNRRGLLFFTGIAASIAGTALLWILGVGGFAFFLFLPFVFFWPRRASSLPARACPSCGFHSRDPTVRFCPHDGTPLSTS